MYWIHNPADVERWMPYLIHSVGEERQGTPRGSVQPQFGANQTCGRNPLRGRRTCVSRAEPLQPALPLIGESLYLGLL